MKKAKSEDEKPIPKGIAFPTSIAVNECVGNFSPEATETRVLAEGDVVKMFFAFINLPSKPLFLIVILVFILMVISHVLRRQLLFLPNPFVRKSPHYLKLRRKIAMLLLVCSVQVLLFLTSLRLWERLIVIMEFMRLRVSFPIR